MPKYKIGDYVTISYCGDETDVAKIVGFQSSGAYIADVGFDDNTAIVEEDEIIGITDDRFDFDKLN